MTEESNKRSWIAHSRKSTEYLYYPPRVSIRIEIGDWKRWIRNIKSIPERELLYRDIAFACFGVAVPSLINGFVSLPNVSQFPYWVSIVHFAIFTVALVIGIVSLTFDQKIKNSSVLSINSILLDMNEVHERSVRSEEKTYLSEEDSSLLTQHSENAILVIKHASYGAEDTMYDVTSILNSHILENKIDMFVSNDNLGGDPIRGVKKVLRILYSYSGQIYELEFHEGERIILPPKN